MGVRLKGSFAACSSVLRRCCREPSRLARFKVPPNGEPILLLGDCQTIGGYPKIAHVITVDFPALAQLREGDVVRFVAVTLVDAQRWLVEREREVERFRIGLELRTA